MARRDRKRSFNDGRIQNPSNAFGIVPLSNFVPRGFAFVHHSIATFYHEVPNPNLTIRNFFIAVHRRTIALWRHEARRAASTPLPNNNNPPPSCRAPAAAFAWSAHCAPRASRLPRELLPRSPSPSTAASPLRTDIRNDRHASALLIASSADGVASSSWVLPR